MKRFLSLFLILGVLTGSAYAATQELSVTDDTDVQEATSNYLKEWFSDQLSMHYSLSNDVVTFFSFENKDNHIDAYGCFEAIHSLKYKTLDELPYIQGVKQTLNIESASAFAGAYDPKLEATSLCSSSGSDAVSLTSVQAEYLANQVKEQLNAVQTSMTPDTGAYYFHISADYNDSTLKDAEITLEIEGKGFVDPTDVLPDSASELKATGIKDTMSLMQEVSTMSDTALTKAETRSGPVEGYDQIAARDYALKYAENMSTSCNCGALNINEGEGVTYSAWNNSVYPYQSTFCHNDCADFVSQALSAGGLPEGGSWFRTKYSTGQNWGGAWTSTSQMKKYMLENDYWKSGTFANTTAGHICYTSPSHVVLITLNDTVTHRYTGHTNDRHNVIFKDTSGWVYYAVNMAEYA